MTLGLIGAYLEFRRPLSFLISDLSFMLGFYLQKEKVVSLFFHKSFILALSELARASRPQVLNLHGRIVPSDFSIRTVHSGHDPYCVCRHQFIDTAYVGRQVKN